MHVVYLFDIDGTLLTCGGAGRRAFDSALAQTFGVVNASAGIPFSGKTDRWILQEVYRAHHKEWPEGLKFDDFFHHYLPFLDAELRKAPAKALPFVAETLAFLARKSNATIGLATGNVRGGSDRKLTSAGIAPEQFCFGGWGCDAIARADMVGIAKQRGFERAPGGGATKAVVIGDTEHDIAAARACGLEVIAVRTGDVPEATLASADHVWDDLSPLNAWHQAQ